MFVNDPNFEKSLISRKGKKCRSVIGASILFTFLCDKERQLSLFYLGSGVARGLSSRFKHL